MAPRGEAAEDADRTEGKPVTGDHPVFRFGTGDDFADIAVSASFAPVGTNNT